MQAVYAQNLVPNHSFEQYDTCPYTGSQMYFANPWFSPTKGTPDYYNACSPIMNVPNSPLGFLEAQDGNAYIGLNAVNFLETEYLAVKLSEPLIPNTNYCISFYTSIAQNGGWYCSVEKIGVYFSKDYIYDNTLWYLQLTPQIRNLMPITDTNWVEITGTYTSLGGEQYIYLGNFDSLNNSFTCPISSTGYGTYLYIDNVSVVETSKCDVFSNFLPNVITPNNDGVNDIIDIPTESTIVNSFVYNRWGNLVFEHSGNNVFWDGTCNGNTCSNGVYYMVIQYEMNGKQMMKQTYIHLFN